MDPSRLELYWIPLGAGARVVRASGRIYERCLSIVERRIPRPLFHSALVADTPEGRYVIEVTPIPVEGNPEQRGVVGQAPVGSQLLGRFRIFRYEIRRWRHGRIPDIAFAVESPVQISDDPAVVSQVLDSLRFVPTPVWGRDELEAGEMWNSNSVVSWTLACAGVLEAAGSPPHNGRAPGWTAGMVVANRRPLHLLQESRLS